VCGDVETTDDDEVEKQVMLAWYWSELRCRNRIFLQISVLVSYIQYNLQMEC
jgi:hypothetical protein